MTERKPRHVSFDSWIDQLIREAEARGDFDGLEGQGKPLENLDEVQNPSWWARRWVQREKLSVVPPAIEIRRTAEQTIESLPRFRREQDAREALETLNANIRRLNSLAHTGPPTTLAPLDVEAHLARWREARARLEQPRQGAEARARLEQPRQGAEARARLDQPREAKE